MMKSGVGTTWNRTGTRCGLCTYPPSTGLVSPPLASPAAVAEAAGPVVQTRSWGADVVRSGRSGRPQQVVPAVSGQQAVGQRVPSAS